MTKKYLKSTNIIIILHFVTFTIPSHYIDRHLVILEINRIIHHLIVILSNSHTDDILSLKKKKVSSTLVLFTTICSLLVEFQNRVYDVQYLFGQELDL